MPGQTLTSLNRKDELDNVQRVRDASAGEVVVEQEPHNLADQSPRLVGLLHSGLAAAEQLLTLKHS